MGCYNSLTILEQKNTMIKKIITVGNSKALTISKDILNQVDNADMADVRFVP